MDSEGPPAPSALIEHEHGSRRISGNDLRFFAGGLIVLALVSIFSLQRISSVADQQDTIDSIALLIAQLNELKYVAAQAEKTQLRYFLAGETSGIADAAVNDASSLITALRQELETLALRAEITSLLDQANATWEMRRIRLNRAASLYEEGERTEGVALATSIDDTSERQLYTLLERMQELLEFRRNVESREIRNRVSTALIAPLLTLGILVALGIHYARRYSSERERQLRSIADLSKSKANLERSILDRNADLEQLTEELQEANAQKDKFLALLGHELRNPLAPVVSTAELLLHGEPDKKEIRDAARMIYAQCRRMMRLVNDLLDVGQIASGKLTFNMQPVDLRRILDSVARAGIPVAEEQNITLQLELPEQPVPVEGDGGRLSQVVDNLLHNALKFSHAGDQIRVALGRTDSTARLVISDTGEGMDSAMADRIFEPFYQADRSDRRGLGLGLAIVKDVVEAHGGKISATSEGHGKGTIITIDLPMTDKPVEDNPSSGDIEIIEEPQPLNFLIVDDYQANAQSLAELLELSGHSCRFAASGDEAIARYKEDRPDVVLLDLGLPDMDGVEVGRVLLRLDPDACLIAVTGLGHDTIREQTEEAGFAMHLVKPVRLAELMDAIARTRRIC